jgi:hypothetical protein
MPFVDCRLLHGEERRSAATSVHAALLAPGQVTIYEGNSFPKRFDPAVSAVLFPSATAVPVSELAMERLENVLLIDSKVRRNVPRWMASHRRDVHLSWSPGAVIRIRFENTVCAPVL